MKNEALQIIRRRYRRREDLGSDFAALTSEHPDVPDLVKQQVYDRFPDSPQGPP